MLKLVIASSFIEIAAVAPAATACRRYYEAYDAQRNESGATFVLNILTCARFGNRPRCNYNDDDVTWPRFSKFPRNRVNKEAPVVFHFSIFWANHAVKISPVSKPRVTPRFRYGPISSAWRSTFGNPCAYESVAMVSAIMLRHPRRLISREHIGIVMMWQFSTMVAPPGWLCCHNDVRVLQLLA